MKFGENWTSGFRREVSEEKLFNNFQVSEEKLFNNFQVSNMYTAQGQGKITPAE